MYHIWVAQLLFNVCTLAYLGPIVEQHMGYKRLGIFLAVCGIVTSLTITLSTVALYITTMQSGFLYVAQPASLLVCHTSCKTA